MARAVVLSSIDEFMGMIRSEKSQLEEIESEVRSICPQLLAMRRFIEDGDVDEADREDEAARRDQYLHLARTIHEAEEAIVNYVLKKAPRKRRKAVVSMLYDCRARENFHKKMSSISKSIKELKVNFKESSRRHYSVSFDEAEEAVGLSEVMKHLIHMLRYHNIISILGIKGIGKTMLAQVMYKNSIVDGSFQCKAWVCASAMGNDLEDILKEISEQLKELSRYNRYFLVIDDVSDPQLWSDMKDKIIQQVGGLGRSKIILTTRDVEVASSADYSHRLKVLSKAESWELFRKKLFIASQRQQQLGINESDKDTTKSGIPAIPLRPELDAIGREMLEKCGGIPYLIVDLANLLSTKNAKTVEGSCVLDGLDTNHHPWFNLSCSIDDFLPSHVKHFLHLFPKGTEISKRRLNLSWAVEEEAAITRSWVQDLQELNLIQAAKIRYDGAAKTYRIPPDPPLLHILKPGGGGGGGLELRPDDSSHSSSNSKVWIHRISDHFNRKDHHYRCIQRNICSSTKDLEPYKTLHSVQCFNYPRGYNPGEDDLGSLLLKRWINSGKQLLFLRVLDLEGVYKPSLPEAVGELINLRYLGLRWTFLDTLPSSISKLWNLQTLDTKHTDIVCYPTIQNIQRLQHLYLNGWHRRGFITELSNLIHLQTLSGVIVDNSSRVRYGLDKLKQLIKLRLTCRWLYSHQKRAMAKWIGELENLQTLKLTMKEEGDQSSWFLSCLRNKQLSRMYLRGRFGMLDNLHHEFGSNLTELTFSLTELTTDPMPILEGLPKLKLLSLFSKSFIGVHMHCKSRMFKELRILKIWKLETLVEWTVEHGAMAELKELEIRSCKKLKMLPDHLPEALLELKLTDMPKEFTNNVVTGEDCQKVAHVSSVIITEDTLHYLNTSIELYAGQNVFFDQLEKFFEGDRFKVINLTLCETKLKQDPMPLLEKLPELMVLTLASKSFTGKRMVCSQGRFSKLQKLTIRELEELEELTVEDGAMQMLEELEIRSCKNFKLLHDVLWTLKKLKSLKLANMPKEFTEEFKAEKRRVMIIQD